MKTYDFMKNRNLWFGISIATIVVGFIFMIIHGGLNFGIDFVGGTSIQADLKRTFEVSEIRELTDSIDKEATITYAGKNRNEVIVKTKVVLDNKTRAGLLKQFDEKFNVKPTNIIFETIGPSVGNEIKKQAGISLLLAFVAIMIYVTIRFEMHFGAAAIAALVHDAIIMVMAYSIFNIPVNGTFIAALLTIIGYSINDTIVVFDRIRENMKAQHNRKIDYDNLVNVSISQTLIRSIITSLTTLLTVLALYFLGVPAIKEFALPMIVGIVVGCYSSIFIASPLWVMLKSKSKLAH